MNQTVRIKIRTVYGNTVVYPHGTRARAFARIAGTKTLTRSVLQEIEELGFFLQCPSPIGWVDISVGAIFAEEAA